MSNLDLFDVLFWASLLIAAGLMVWAAFGDSPTTNQIIIALLVPTLLGVFSLREKHGERTTEIIQKIDSMNDTLQRIENTLKQAEEKL
ncbi:MAG: hypothetical protein SVY41_03425 [Candidatus Nanohaloarchaea archaeon]|nr:hypothetical protein [Candidatus Nanohaloarchaea archaeon]